MGLYEILAMLLGGCLLILVFGLLRDSMKAKERAEEYHREHGYKIKERALNAPVLGDDEQ